MCVLKQKDVSCLPSREPQIHEMGVLDNHGNTIVYRNISMRRRQAAVLQRVCVRIGGSIRGCIFRSGKETYMEITYKRASMKDIDVLVDTRLEALNLAEKTEDSAAMMRRRRQTYSYFRRNLSENQNVAYLVYNGSQIAAFGDVIFYHRRPLFNQNKERAYISNLYTKPEYQNTEIPFRLLELLVLASLENGAEEITADEEIAVDPLYRKYGFTKKDSEWSLVEYA